ncbi:hypothetical protein B0H14DRAFT_2561418 [Mycena olivaceomarginata]|nr:hypothetical protein B0H14DRAFT_2561418 [Mycena olivaceomarginata]
MVALEKGHDKLPNYDGPDARTFDALKKILRMPQWFRGHLLKNWVSGNIFSAFNGHNATLRVVKKHRQATLLASSLISISPGVIFFPLLFLSILGFGQLELKAGPRFPGGRRIRETRMEDSYLLARDSQECSRPACGTTNMRRSSGPSGSRRRLLLFLPVIWSEFEGKIAEYLHLGEFKQSNPAECKASKANRLAYVEKTGIPSALPDLVAWIKYYEAPLKNCAVAAMRLPENPHMERKAILCLILCYLEDTMPLLHQRFRMEEIGLRELDEMRAGGAVGDDFEDGLPRVLRAWQAMIHFSIDKDLARENIVRQEWWLLLSGYNKLGARMKLCCGRAASVEDVLLLWMGPWRGETSKISIACLPVRAFSDHPPESVSEHREVGTH